MKVIHCERLIKLRWLVLLLPLLLAADFIANVPVFVELFPANELVDEAVDNWEQQAVSQGLTPRFGARHMLARVLAYPEPSILAFSVILFFLFLGHELGAALRRLVALWRHRRPSASWQTAHVWRQALWPAAMCLAGVVSVIVVLYVARARVEPMAAERVARAQVALEAADIELATRENIDDPSSDVQSAVTARFEARDNFNRRRQRLDYAQALDGMNAPITGLNVVLILAAIVMGYLSHRGRYALAPGAEPGEVTDPRRELDVLSANFISRRAEAHVALGAGGAALNRVDHLLRADLSADWQGKSERLERAIPIFRSENALHRSLDVADILAFESEASMSLPTYQQHALKLKRPEAQPGYATELAALGKRLARLDEDTAPARGEPHAPSADGTREGSYGSHSQH
jgi:hypothetical protein